MLARVTDSHRADHDDRIVESSCFPLFRRVFLFFQCNFFLFLAAGARLLLVVFVSILISRKSKKGQNHQSDRSALKMLGGRGRKYSFVAGILRWDSRPSDLSFCFICMEELQVDETCAVVCDR